MKKSSGLNLEEICTDQALFTSQTGGGGGGGIMGVELKCHNDGFVSYKYASFGFSKRLTDGLERCGLYYGLIPTAPIHWRGFIGDVMLHFSKSVLTKKQTQLNLGVHLYHILISGRTSPLNS